jgi:hypothetical protein
MGAQSMTTQTPNPHLGDRSLIDAALQLSAARSAKADDIYEIASIIHQTPAKSPLGVAIKLRLLCDEDMGIPAGPSDDDRTSLRQLLEYAEDQEKVHFQFLHAFEKFAAERAAEVAAGADVNDQKLLALISERDQLEAKVVGPGMTAAMSERAFNALVGKIGREIGSLDDQIAGFVARTSAGIVGQIGVLLKLHSSAFDGDDTDHPTGCFERLAASITAAVRRLGGAT